MTPAKFEGCNIKFTASSGLDESQVMTIPGFLGIVEGGSMDGSRVCVVAWQPEPEEMELLKQGRPIFISMVGGLAPHFLCMSFEQAVRPA